MVPPDRGNKGSGFWISGPSYPLPGTRRVTYHLASSGHANSREGDGRLMIAADSSPDGPPMRESPPDRFTYDPRDPVPTVGGNFLNATLVAGAADQSAVELRKDVLVYTSVPLTEDMAVIGDVRATIWAISSATDTDFSVKVVDVHPDQITHNVLDRIVRARFRQGTKQPWTLITPGKAYEYSLYLGDTATIFRAGHRVRVEVSSSNFPRVARNTNTGHPNPNADTDMKPADQMVLHDRQHPSRIELSVVPSRMVAAPGRH
jgi:hypothetical protein